jgi:hypothetical protein
MLNYMAHWQWAIHQLYPRLHMCLQIDLEAAGYCTPMHPSAYSHVLFLVHMPDTGLWRWSYMERSQLWRHPPDQPARFSKSVATVSDTSAQVREGKEGVQRRDQQKADDMVRGYKPGSALQHPLWRCLPLSVMQGRMRSSVSVGGNLCMWPVGFPDVWQEGASA